MSYKNSLSCYDGFLGTSLNERCRPPNFGNIIKLQIEESPIKHILIDFGGVLSPKSYVLPHLSNSIKNYFNINSSRTLYDEYYTESLRTGQVTETQFISTILDRWNIKHSRSDLEKILGVWHELCSENVKIIPEMIKLIELLRKRGFKVSILSNTYGLKADNNRAKGFYDLFDNVFLSYEIGFKKPYREIYEYVIDELRIKPTEILFIDNKMVNLDAAHNIDIKAIQLDNRIFLIEILEDFLRRLETFDIYISIDEINKPNFDDINIPLKLNIPLGADHRHDKVFFSNANFRFKINKEEEYKDWYNYDFNRHFSTHDWLAYAALRVISNDKRWNEFEENFWRQPIFELSLDKRPISRLDLLLYATAGPDYRDEITFKGHSCPFEKSTHRILFDKGLLTTFYFGLDPVTQQKYFKNVTSCSHVLERKAIDFFKSGIRAKRMGRLKKASDDFNIGIFYLG